MTIKTAMSTLRDDIRAIFQNDPAARNMVEVFFYPGLHAIVGHRIAHMLWQRKLREVARVLSFFVRFLTGIEIHPGAHIGRGFFIDHGSGVVIGETAIIGNRVTLYQGVTLGGTGKQGGKRHPTIEDDVVIGVGSIVLGDITIGKHARVGGGSVVIKDVPPNSTAVGVPARIVATRDPHTGETRRIEHLPDPEGEQIHQLRTRVRHLEERMKAFEHPHENKPAANHHIAPVNPSAEPLPDSPPAAPARSPKRSSS